MAAIVLVAGLILGRGGLEVVGLDPRSDLVGALTIVALVVILFRDGVEVEVEMLQREWRLPMRKLVLAMPITCVLVACAGKLLTDLTWAQSFLVGALLSPTDPVLSSSVVTNPRVPRVIRHSLNLESGLNDGLALPAVLAFAYALDPSKSDFVWWRFVLQDVTLGFALGITVGYLASKLPGRALPIAAALATYGLARAVHGNGLIAIFVCAITLGILRPDIRDLVDRRSEILIQAAKLGIFFVFGAVLTLHGLFQDGAAAVAIVVFTLLLARPAAVFGSLLGTRTDTVTRLFMGWFGPKGVATMSFSLLVLGEGIADGERIFNIAALAVVVSIIAHGLTDSPGVNLIARHAERSAA
ncbi:MAG: sodium/hydrogen antiporter [Thermoleophilaceae bacterium]|nr:sodium/hydrogen antiporter [Thermoleophilaceae bacterium]